MLMKRLSWVAVVIAVGAQHTCQAGLIIDSFEDAVDGVWPVTKTTVGFRFVEEPDVMGVAGEWRDTTVGVTQLTVWGVDQVTVNISPSDGLLDFASSAGADGLVALSYERGLNVNHLGVDLSSDTMLRVDISEFDLAGGAPMRIAVRLNESRPPPFIYLEKFVTEAGAQSVEFPFAEFSDIEFMDLSNVGSITVTVDPGPGGDFHIRRIVSVIPEPATMGLLAFGAFILIRRKRRLSRGVCTFFATSAFLLAACSGAASAQETVPGIHLGITSIDTTERIDLSSMAYDFAGQTGGSYCNLMVR